MCRNRLGKLEIAGVLELFDFLCFVDCVGPFGLAPGRRRAAVGGASGRKKQRERVVKARISASIGLGLSLTLVLSVPLMADGFKNCTKVAKSSWKPASEAEAAAKAAGYEVRRSKIEGSCYEVYGVKGGKLYELFYSPADLKLIHTKAK
jgi:hypothetical protein